MRVGRGERVGRSSTHTTSTSIALRTQGAALGRSWPQEVRAVEAVRWARAGTALDGCAYTAYGTTALASPSHSHHSLLLLLRLRHRPPRYHQHPHRSELSARTFVSSPTTPLLAHLQHIRTCTCTPRTRAQSSTFAHAHAHTRTELGVSEWRERVQRAKLSVASALHTAIVHMLAV